MTLTCGDPKEETGSSYFKKLRINSLGTNEKEKHDSNVSSDWCQYNTYGSGTVILGGKQGSYVHKLAENRER